MKILVADPIAQEGIELLSAEAQVDIKVGLKPKDLAAIIGEYDALVVRSETRASREIIEAGAKLQVIGRAGVGVDNIDVEAATRRGIVVVNAPASNTIAAAEHTIALMLALARHIPQANAALKSGRWQRSEFIGIEVRNKALGIIGLGRVGSEVARRAQGLQMHVLARDPFISVDYAQNLGVELVSLEELLGRSDFISLHMPLTETTRGLIGAKELSQVKSTVRIINTARGGMVDEEALFQAIEEERVAGAAIDVFAQEPAKDSILFKSGKIIVTPHLGASTAEAQANVAVDIAEQILAVLRGQPASYALNAPLILPETLPILAPYMEVCSHVARLASQLSEGQPSNLLIKYEGEIAEHDTTVLKAAIIRGLLESSSEERVNLVNASHIATQRGLKILEQKSILCENYANCITLEVTTNLGLTEVAGTLMRGEPHIVRVDEKWIDVIPTGGYWLFIDHRDRPGLIGAVGTVAGKADINISSMQVGRLQPRGKAMMALGLDEPLPEEQLKEILSIPDIYAAKVVKL